MERAFPLGLGFSGGMTDGLSTLGDEVSTTSMGEGAEGRITRGSRWGTEGGRYSSVIWAPVLLLQILDFTFSLSESPSLYTEEMRERVFTSSSPITLFLMFIGNLCNSCVNVTVHRNSSLI